MHVSRRAVVIVGGLVTALAIAIPAMGAGPTPRPTPPGHAKADKGPELERTVRGTVETSTDADGRPAFSITADGETWTLSAGPSWYWGDEHPLAAWVGKTVEVAGTYHEGETELDVETVDGDASASPASRRGPADRGSSARSTRAGSRGWPTGSRARATAARTHRVSRRRTRPGTTDS